ncbi:GNAT family N-acetyltransferase [Ferroplasma acidiphilum]|uniref:GNAT family N-acetyltransferase n=1 Tax=Ferroplasma acidiphilum TaxID=74969 RepID=UPI0023F1BE50|nr:GNAT family N-acetyltransferase [Ferroplasma acidiphilum]
MNAADKKIEIRHMILNDWEGVNRIYDNGIKTGNATFETAVPDWINWDKNHIKKCRFVAIYGDVLSGWCALSPISTRPAYSGVAEISIYVDSNYRGKGIGSALMGALINESEQCNIWTLQSTIFPENQASLMLHKKHGFRTVGTREKISKINNVWHDTLLLERRSNIF